MDVHQVGYSLKKFLTTYNNVLLEEHREELQEHFKYLKKFKSSSLISTESFGYHWDICPYASESSTDVPETCDCISVENIMTRAIKLMKLYERIRFQNDNILSNSN